MKNNNTLTATGILTFAFLAQIAGHLLLKQYMPNAAIGSLGFLLIAIIFMYVLFFRHDTYGFILIVYVCSHFSYAEYQGGLWNFMTFGVLTLYYLVMNKKLKEFPIVDSKMLFLLWVFVLWNMMGWAFKNPIEKLQLFQGIASFLGFLFMFILVSNLIISKERFRLFITVVCFMAIYQFLAIINQRYHILTLNTPLIGTYSSDGAIFKGFSKEYLAGQGTSGTIGHYELFGEYGMLMICLLIPLLSSSLTQREINFGSNRIVVTIFLCISFILSTSNRACAVLVVFAIFVYYPVFVLRIFSSIDKVGRQFKLIAIISLLLPIVGIYVGLDKIEDDFSELKSEKFTTSNVFSGKSINRGSLVTMGVKRLKKTSWLLGHGYGVYRSNSWAWFGVDPGDHKKSKLADLHSLYLSLPQLYGWTGSLAFLLMIIITVARLFIVAVKYRKKKSFLIVLAVGFFMFWITFLINEYKISIIRTSNYHMMFWIWLGLSNSLVRTIRYEMSNKSICSSRSPGF